MLSHFAERLLRLHADRHDKLFYGIDVLGSLFRPSDLKRLDEGYLELEKAGLVEDSREELSYFGDWKKLYQVTESGMSHLKAAAVS